NDFANALCVLISFKVRLEHDPALLKIHSAIYDRLVRMIVQHWDDAFEEDSRTLKVHISLVHGAKDYD
ncbi:hypothetical protein PFISCL1PPCAC_21458, partial [Pristionchus fissidentatus]